jgi:glyoxalase family protein
MTSATAFSVPSESLGYWVEHLTILGVDAELIADSAGADRIELRDHDGMRLQLVGTVGDGRSGWDGSGNIPAEHAVRGLHSVELSETMIDPTASMLQDLLGMNFHGEESGRANFSMGEGSSGAQVEIVGGVREQGFQAGGTVHHVAFSAPDLATMETWQAELRQRGVSVTEIMDRQYFRSIYFREPGGVLFEIATDDPGFATDEPLLELGRQLKLPPWLEPSREQIQQSLPSIKVGVHG